MKTLKLRYTTLSLLIGSTFILGGCSDTASTKEHSSQMKVGHFISVFDKKVNYQCANSRKALSDNGEFQCQSFPIAFYMDDVKLGEIHSIHQDGYVFPQDIIVLEENSAVYSSDDNMMFASLEEE